MIQNLKTFAMSVSCMAIMAGGALGSTIDPKTDPQTWTEGSNGDLLCANNNIAPTADGCFGLVLGTNDSTDPDTYSKNIDLNVDIFDYYPDDVDNGSDDAAIGLFGSTDWMFFAKSENGTNASGVSYTVNEDTGIVDYFLPVSDLTGLRTVLAFKQSNDIAFYLFEGDASSGTYNLGNLFPNNDDSLSHLSVYTAPIPLPAAGWLLLSAIGGLGIAARRRRKSS